MTSCVSSPALDVVAVGCADGKIHVHNIRYDEELVTFSHSTRGAVTALSFSTGKNPELVVCADTLVFLFGMLSLVPLEDLHLFCLVILTAPLTFCWKTNLTVPLDTWVCFHSPFLFRKLL